MNKSPARGPQTAKRLADLIGKPLADAFKRQGFASREIVTRWPEIAGPEIAAHAEPMRMQWQRQKDDGGSEPATLVLRVEGPAAIEIQHLSGLVIERVNRFFGWQAIDRITLRQAPLTRRPKRPPLKSIDTATAERIARALPVADDALRAALGRLGAALKRL